MTRRLLTYVLATFCIAAGGLRAAEPQIPVPPALAARAYILVDHNSGRVLVTKQDSEHLDPASITKLMTAYVVFRSLREGRVKADDQVVVSEAAWRTGGSRSFIDVGSRVPIKILLQGMIIQSGNDASVALAEHVAGSEPAFAGLMNQYAKELGMKDTSYTNATGLPDPQHYTSAADIAKLASAIIREFPEYYRWYSQKDFTYNGITQSNRNGLLWKDPTVDGMKTGFTDTAGYCLVSSAVRDGMRLVSVVLGTDSPSAREKESQILLNHGFRFYESKLVAAAGKPLREARVWKGRQETIGVGVNRDLYVTVPRGTAATLQPQFELPAQVIAPLDPKVAIGKLRVSVASQPVVEAALFALAVVPTGSLWQQARDTVLLWFE